MSTILSIRSSAIPIHAQDFPPRNPDHQIRSAGVGSDPLPSAMLIAQNPINTSKMASPDRYTNPIKVTARVRSPMLSAKLNGHTNSDGVLENHRIISGERQPAVAGTLTHATTHWIISITVCSRLLGR